MIFNYHLDPEGNSQTTGVVPSGVLHREPSPATPPAPSLRTHRGYRGQAVWLLPIFCAVLTIYAFQSAACPRLSLLMPVVGARPHAALLPRLPCIISNLRRDRYCLHNDGTRFALWVPWRIVHRSARPGDAGRNLCYVLRGNGASLHAHSAHDIVARLGHKHRRTYLTL